MDAVTVINRNIFIDKNSQRGASILEVLLVIGIVTLLAPFAYNQIAQTSAEIRDIGNAKKIIDIREPALNFVRLNQDKWPNIAQIRLSPDELNQITDAAHAGFIDKYTIQGATVTDIYLAFSMEDGAMQAARIAKHMGTNAAVADMTGVAYGAHWAITAPDFKPGDLIYRIDYSFSGDDASKYLHRGSNGEDKFNVMQRALNMGGYDVQNIGTAVAESAKLGNSQAAFTTVKNLATSSAYFSNGANMDGTSVQIGSMRVNGDIMGFRTMYAKKMNRDGFSTTGNIISDRVSVRNSVNVGRNMNLKSDSLRTISGFAGITSHSLATPYVYSDEMLFSNNFGLTVSGELLMSTSAPIKIGSWSFPSGTLPKFLHFELSRARIPTMPGLSEFDKMIGAGWRDLVGQP